VFVIGPDKKIKPILVYPMTTGRNFDEVLRVIDSLQLTANHKVATPANWTQGDDVIISGSGTDAQARELFGEWDSPARTSGSCPSRRSTNQRSGERALGNRRSGVRISPLARGESPLQRALASEIPDAREVGWRDRIVAMSRDKQSDSRQLCQTRVHRSIAPARTSSFVAQVLITYE
jgi:hypothetical protein